MYIRLTFKDLKNNQNQIDDYKLDHVIKYIINFGENNYNETIRMSLQDNKTLRKSEVKRKASYEARNEL